MAFVFTPTADAKDPRSARKIHIRRLYDVMHLCIQRNDFERATRAWTILAHCQEVNWRTMWSTSVHILSAKNLKDPEQTVAFLRLMMLQHPEDRETILKEMVLRLIISEQYRDALDELELYLPSFPYQDNAVLHVYAGLLSMYISQPTSERISQFNPTLLRSAQTYFERAKILDPDNSMAEAFLHKIQKLNGTDDREESDEEDGLKAATSTDKPKRKRVRTEIN
ncbi:RNA polymerase I-specific transcription initiation factor rrn11 [Mycena venus]|uniref:RNA polymerase I-specific transcription initiation factor rrn11 n=1 Tax=Mycena venus TaxID=2733690 RepID=A0A8H6Y6N0_9AGAR|nr:RNA polymerase I-specific transcription initiation factor rrn11 [Mycena venus]